MKTNRRVTYWDIIASAIWAYAICNSFIYNIDDLLATAGPAPLFLVNHKLEIVLAIAAAVLTLLPTSTVAMLAAYITLFPAVIFLWKIPRRLFFNWPVAIALSPAVYDLLKNFRHTCAIHALALISAIVIYTTAEPFSLWISIVVLGAYLSDRMIRSTWRAYSESMFESLAKWIVELRRKVANGHWDSHFRGDAPSQLAREKNAEKRQQEGISLLYLADFTTHFLSDGANTVARTKKVELWLLALMITSACQIVASFSFMYLALHKIDDSMFTGAATTTFASFLGFSLSIFTSVEISPIHAATALSQGFCYAELICFWVLIVIVVFTTLTVMRDKYTNDIVTFAKELQLTANEVNSVAIRIYQVAIMELEARMYEKDPSLIDSLRQLRGMPPRQKNSTAETSTSSSNDVVAHSANESIEAPAVKATGQGRRKRAAKSKKAEPESS